MNDLNGENKEEQRVDKWLWYARIFKTRGLASNFAVSGKIRINGIHNKKSSYCVRAGDVLTFVLNDKVRVLKILGFASRRGPFREASLLYEDLSPEFEVKKKKSPNRNLSLANSPKRSKGAGRPTKKERRDIEKLMRV